MPVLLSTPINQQSTHHSKTYQAPINTRQFEPPPTQVSQHHSLFSLFTTASNLQENQTAITARKQIKGKIIRVRAWGMITKENSSSGAAIMRRLWRVAGSTMPGEITDVASRVCNVSFEVQ